jgi:hypothetical protein
VETRIPRLERMLRVVIVLTAANVIGESVTSNHQVQKTTHQNKNSQYKFNKPQRQYINQLVEAAVKKTKHDSNVVESDEDDEWSKGMTAGEHMYVLSAAQTDQGTDSTKLEIDDNDLEDFKKRYRATIYKLLFKSCRIAPQCLRKTKSQQSTCHLYYIIVILTSVHRQICPL